MKGEKLGEACPNGPKMSLHWLAQLVHAPAPGLVKWWFAPKHCSATMADMADMARYWKSQVRQIELVGQDVLSQWRSTGNQG